MERPVSQQPNFTSDLPQTDPKQDALGYAPFARRIANAITETSSPQGLVLAVHGPWGAGKTTVLNFIKYYLSDDPEGDRPIVLDFNPWWFTSREHLAQQFLADLRSKLANESETIRKAGDLLGEYAGAIGKTVGWANSVPWLAKPIEFALKLFKRKQRTVPELKTDISAKLKSGPRIVVFVDDIDRLVPEEICELFKVVKAVADFPNIIYVLSLDREVVGNALNVSLHIDGEAYLEKIIQAPFTLPAVDRILLRKMFFSELDLILEGQKASVFNAAHWANIYFGGLDQYIAKPRDIVRIKNVLAVAYPAVAGEVNAVDFIALEILRIFEPKVYAVINDHREMFLNSVGDQAHEKDARKAFHLAWLDQVQKQRQAKVKELVSRLFPHVAAAFGNLGYGGGNWRKDLRVCAPAIFDVYFQFGATAHTVSKAELASIVALARKPEEVASILKEASLVIRADGTSKARELLERLEDVADDLDPVAASGILRAIFSVGDEILVPKDEEGFRTPNLWKLRWAIEHLLKRVSNQEDLLAEVVTKGQALRLIAFIIDTIGDPKTAKESPLSNVATQVFYDLKKIYCSRISAFTKYELIELTDLSYLAHQWNKWSGDDAAREALRPIWESDELLPKFLEGYIHYSTQWGGADVVARRVPRLNVKNIEPLVPLDLLEPRVRNLSGGASLTELQQTAVELFLLGMERIRNGAEPIDDLD